MDELGRAARAGDEARVKSLLREGAAVNARGSIGRTALHFACETHLEDIKRVVDVLLEAGADVNAQDMYGRTPLHLAVAFFTGGGWAKFVFDETARTNAQANRWRLGSSWTSGTRRPGRSRETQRVLVDALLEAGAQMNIQDEHGQTALHVAIKYREMDLVKALLSKNTSERSKERSSQHLVDHPQVCMVNLRDHNGDTALHKVFNESITVGKIKESVCLLLRAGATVGIKNNEGRTALHVAVHKRKEIIDLLLNIREDVDATDKYGDTPLHVASEKGQTETVRLLLRAGAKVGVKNAMEMTPLHKAVAFGEWEIVDILVDFGENVSDKDVYGNTPLHHLGVKRVIYYSESYKIKARIAFIINLLITRGAKIDEQNMDGKKPYELIAMRDEFGLLGLEIVEEALIKQVIRLKTLGLQDKIDISWILGPDFYNNAKHRCCQELEDMKSTMVVKDISLYQVLSHINHSYLYQSPGDLQQIDRFLFPPDLLIRFPLYGDTLKITFQRAKLLTLAVQSFYSETREQMWKKLPLFVVEQLLNLLSNKDLRTFIESE